ncbi:MAG: hypothetical protein NWS20_02985 [Rickettsiaceae bacterium]|nr:hypothetical protein [Rickettsiaceae bacterium]MDP4832814.1 hypothetical protein [Rickettsiaceae bacterium]MDP5020469.1 hypothetical protein [Rickettsiaceae bacterium]MDP5083159.1 hypothetical protein [Rickettsiaceae bacterium]
MQYIRLLLIVLLLPSLNSCGFNSMYKADNNPTFSALENIDITMINSVEGADFYNHLQNIMPHGPAAKYTLTTNCSFMKSISVIQKNSDILREVVTIKVSYELKDKATENKITTGQFSRFSSFNTTFSPYSNVVSQQDKQKNLAIMSAEEVRNRIMMFFKNNSNT